MTAATTFFFDVGSPYAYLAAERVDELLPGVRWSPVLLGGLFKLSGRRSWAVGERWRRELGMHEIERRARSYGLAPVVWPDPWPGDNLAIMRAVTYAFAIEHGREFALEAVRAAFARGRDLSQPSEILQIAWSAGLDPGEVQEAVADPAIRSELRDRTDAAFALGVIGVPTVAVGRRLFWGDDQLEAAAEAAGA